MALKIIEREVIKDDAITAAKVEDGTVVGADIASGSITNADIKSDAAIAASKIAGLATSATTDTTNASNIASGTLPTARLDTGTTANKIVILDGNAKLPAISGANLTGIESATVSTSDPTISTNPSGGVGTKWINKTSGEVYVCTDATAGENVWTNVGGGSGDVQPYHYGGESYGYSVAGYPTNSQANIDKYSLTSDSTGVDAGFDLSTPNSYHGSQHVQSSTAGYVLGGYSGPHGGYFNKIEKFVFASSSNATSVGNISSVANGVAGCNDASHGYRVGGWNWSGSPPGYNFIERFPFATDGNAVDVGDLLLHGHGMNTSSTETHGYATGAQVAPTTAVQKFAFASSANAVDTTQDLITFKDYAGAGTSDDYGFVMGGTRPSGSQSIDRYAFNSSAAMVDHGDLTTAYHSPAAASSLTHAYVAGNAVSNSKAIQKVQMSSAANATSVADLFVTNGTSCGVFQ